MATFATALLLALLAAAAQGVLYYRDRTPGRAVTAQVGQQVELAGTRLRVQSFTVAASLPNEDPTEPAVAGPPGSLLVLVVWTQQVFDPGVKLDVHRCQTSLVADDGTIWHDDSDLTYGLRRPKALTCGDSDDFPLVLGRERQLGSSYVIPARYAESVRWRLSLDEEQQVVEFRR
jgi:hypothetical protein